MKRNWSWINIDHFTYQSYYFKFPLGITIHIHTGHNPRFENLEYEYIPFIPSKGHDFVRSFDIGLLPLPQNDPFTDGKSPIKGIQYIASGAVVVATKATTAVNLLGGQNNEAEFVKYAKTVNEWVRF